MLNKLIILSSYIVLYNLYSIQNQAGQAGQNNVFFYLLTKIF